MPHSFLYCMSDYDIKNRGKCGFMKYYHKAPNYVITLTSSLSKNSSSLEKKCNYDLISCSSKIVIKCQPFTTAIRHRF